MNSETNHSRVAAEAAATPSKQRPGLSRRAILRASAGASPVLLTLASGSVAANPFANNGNCLLASSFVSVATFKSRNPGVTSVKCATRNADEWVELTNPGTLQVLNVTVAALLGSTSSSYDAELVKNVLAGTTVVASSTPGLQTTGEQGTLQHLLALALNLNGGFITPGGGFDLAYIQTIWSNYKFNGNRYKKPGSEIDWGDTELIAWARFLMYPVLLP